MPKVMNDCQKSAQWKLVATHWGQIAMNRRLIATNQRLIVTNQVGSKRATNRDWSAWICDSFKAVSQNIQHMASQNLTQYFFGSYRRRTRTLQKLPYSLRGCSWKVSSHLIEAGSWETSTTTTQRARKENLERETLAPSTPTVDMEMLEKLAKPYLP